ncbi:PPE family protein, partial [Mycobacterium tuberculosis T46]
VGWATRRGLTVLAR